VAGLAAVSTVAAQAPSSEARALLRAAIADEKAGDGPAAEHKLQQILSGGPPVELEGQVHLELLRIYENSGEWWKALDQLSAVRKLNPTEPEYAYQSGVIYRNLSQWAFERMKAMAPQSARFQQALGEQYSVTGDWAEAIAAYRRALVADPHLAGSHLALAIICLRTGKPSEALTELDAELVLAPQSAMAQRLRQSLVNAPVVSDGAK
jgi:tetratricopeptide (TPR) repeat protein